MKFDVVVGNPPYQKIVGPNKTEPIWDQFVEKGFGLLNDGGFLGMVHPGGWKSPNGRYSNVLDILIENKIHYLNINDVKKGQEVFGAGTDFDFYVVQKEKTEPSFKTLIIDVENKEHLISLFGWTFIPGGKFEEFSKLIAKPGEECVNMLHSFGDYETRNDYMRNSRDDTFKYPCVYTITKKKGITCFYSNTEEHGHFGMPKVIWSNGAASYPIVDSEGKFGMTQFAYAIVDEVENLVHIQTAMNNPTFIDLMATVSNSSQCRWDKKCMGLLRKDFWKEFV